MVLGTSPEMDLVAASAAAAILAMKLDNLMLTDAVKQSTQQGELLAVRGRLEAAARRSAVEQLESAAMALGSGARGRQRNGLAGSLDLDRGRQLLEDSRQELARTEQVIRGLDTARGGLAARLRAVARASSRPSMQVDVKPSSPGVSCAPEDAGRVAVAVRDLLDLAAACRASYVAISVGSDAGGCVVEVRADGRLALAAGPTGANAYQVIRSASRALEPSAAKVQLTNEGSWFTIWIRIPAREHR
jgi:hypothetical protein